MKRQCKGREGKQEKNFGLTVELEVLLSLCYLKSSKWIWKSRGKILIPFRRNILSVVTYLHMNIGNTQEKGSPSLTQILRLCLQKPTSCRWRSKTCQSSNCKLFCLRWQQLTLILSAVRKSYLMRAIIWWLNSYRIQQLCEHYSRNFFSHKFNEDYWSQSVASSN